MAIDLTTAFVDVRPDTRGFEPDLRRKMGRIDSAPAGRKVGEKFGTGLNSSVRRLVGGMAGLFAGTKIIQFFGDSIKGASDLTETINKSNAIFGGNATAIRKWANGAAKAFGLSKTEALSTAASFGDMFLQLGFGADQAAKMSKGVVQMSADLGSFNNLPTADVANRISAAFRGEFDSLQLLIPNINAARVEQEALGITGKKSAKELTAAEKAAATLAIVQRDGARAAGDFARTSDEVANKQKIASAQFADAKAKLGDLLLPIMNAVVGFMSEKMIPAFEKIVTIFREDWLPRIKDAAEFIRDNADVIVPLVAGITALVVAVKIVTAATAAWNAVMNLNPIVRIITLLAALVVGVIAAYKRFETFRNIVDGVWDVVSGVIKFAWENVIRPVFGAIGAAIGTVIGFITKLRDTFKDIWAAIRRIVRDAVKAVVGTFLGFVQAIIDGAAKAFGWVPGLGGKLKKASKDFENFRGDVNKQLDKIADEDVVIKLTGNTSFSGGARSPALAAAGGAIHGPGTGTSDSIPARLSNGEHVLTAREVTAAGGHGAIYAMRKMILGGALRFARGGPADFDVLRGGLSAAGVRNLTMRDLVAVAREAFVSRARPILERLTGPLGFARSQVGKPYIWGGVGPRGYDCSGFMSAITNVIQGRYPFSRRFATGTFPTAAFARGPGNFMIGSFRGNPGHMAGTLLGVNVESSGGVGVRVGGRARGARNRLFGGNAWHLRGFAAGGAIEGDPPFDLLSPRGQRFDEFMELVGGRGSRRLRFDRGFGILPPGRSVVENRTGGPEPLVDPRRVGGGVTVNGPLIGEIKAWNDRFSWPQVQDELALHGVS